LERIRLINLAGRMNELGGDHAILLRRDNSFVRL
jgi:hypothetical protein